MTVAEFNSSWEVFDNWFIDSNETNQFDWQVFLELQPYHKKIIEGQYKQIHPLLNRWNKKLGVLGNDPTYYDWSKFRPLRLSREEDWSDWFTHLIGSSTTGSFAAHLFQNPNFNKEDYINPKNITREEVCNNYRSDVIIGWAKNYFFHIEIKTGDSNLLKTFATSNVFMLKYDATVRTWTNYILLLSSQLPDWYEVVEGVESKTLVTPITWEDVSIALRKALLSKEHVTWKVWAFTFIGAIEQLLIGFKGNLIESKPTENLDIKIDILERGLSK